MEENPTVVAPVVSAAQPAVTTPSSVSDKLMQDAGIGGEAGDKPAEETTTVKPADTGAGGPDNNDKPGDEIDADTGKPKTETKPAVPTAKKPEEKPEKVKQEDDKTGEDIADDLILKALQKKGINVKSLADLNKPAAPPKVLTEAEQAELAERKRTDALKFALDNKIFTKKVYENYLTAQAMDKAELVKTDFFKTTKEKEPELDDEDIKERYEQKYGLLEDEESWQYKDGQRRLELKSKELLHKEYGKVMDMETIFDKVQQNTERAATYKAKVDEVFENSFQLTAEVKIDDETYTPELFTKDALQAIKADYLTLEMMDTLMTDNGDIDVESLTREVMKDLVYDNLNIIIAQVAKSHSEKMVTLNKMGRKGIKPESDVEVTGDANPVTAGGYADNLLRVAQEENTI